MSLKDDDIIRLIENFKFDAGPVAVERRNRGFTLIHAETGVPNARPRPIGRDDLVDILYWSLRRNDGFRSAPSDAWQPASNRPQALLRERQSSGPASKTQAKIRKVELSVCPRTI